MGELTELDRMRSQSNASSRVTGLSGCGLLVCHQARHFGIMSSEVTSCHA